MSHLRLLSVILAVGILLVQPGCKRDSGPPFLGSGSDLGAYWPTAAWRSCTPEEVGMDSDALMQVYDYAANPNINTLGLLIIRKGYIVAEAYFQDHSVSSTFPSYSVAKSFLSSLYGIAVEQGLIPGVDEKVSRYLTEWQDPQHEESKRRMAIAHLLTMSSGLEWNEEDYYGDTSQNDVFKMARTDDYLAYVLAKASLYEPGLRWDYSSGDSMLLSGILERASGQTVFDFARQYLLAPIGATGITWDSDPAGHTIGGWGVMATAREYAKFGYLFLNEGRWDGQQVVPAEWVEASTRPISDQVDWYGYQWWRAPALSGFPGSIVPADTFIAWGIYTQQIFVIPSKDILIVRLGDDARPAGDEWREVEFLTLVLQSLVDN
jgi:CubicO group peptidase (beta-lactamase class C family)